MQKFLVSFFLVFGLLCIAPGKSLSHCQVPCGIYDDHARVVMMLEDVATIKKSVVLLKELGAKDDVQSRQQFTRWVMTKEAHAQKIISTIADYFMTQRIKPSQKDYVERLKAHHAVIVAAMKAKQNASMDPVKALEASVKMLVKYYPEN